MSNNSNTPLLDAFVAVAPFIRELVWFDVAVAVVDSETRTILAFAQGRDIVFPVKAGEPCPEQTIVMETIKTGKRLVKKANGAFGFPYLSIGIPIFEGGILTGAVSFNTSMELQSNFLQMAVDLDRVVQAVDEKSKKMTDKSRDLNATGQRLSALALELKVGMEEAKRQTNLIGLDASIKAARLGQEGAAAGAGESGKMAEIYADFLKQVEDVKRLFQKSQESISNQLIEFISAILSVEGVASSQTALAQEIQETMEIVREKSESVIVFTKKMMS